VFQTQKFDKLLKYYFVSVVITAPSQIKKTRMADQTPTTSLRVSIIGHTSFQAPIFIFFYVSAVFIVILAVIHEFRRKRIANEIAKAVLKNGTNNLCQNENTQKQHGYRRSKLGSFLQLYIYLLLGLLHVMILLISLFIGFFSGENNKPPSKSVLKIFKNGPKNIKNQRFFELFLPKIQILSRSTDLLGGLLNLNSVAWIANGILDVTRFFFYPTQKIHFLAHFKGFFDFFLNF